MVKVSASRSGIIDSLANHRELSMCEYLLCYSLRFSTQVAYITILVIMNTPFSYSVQQGRPSTLNKLPQYRLCQEGTKFGSTDTFGPSSPNAGPPMFKKATLRY